RDTRRLRRCRGLCLAPAVASERDPLREDDLDAAVLRLAHAVRSRYALVVLAATADRHLLPGYAEPDHGVGDGVGTALGEPLVVAGRARGIGVAGDLDRDRSAGAERRGRLLDD